MPAKDTPHRSSGFLAAITGLGHSGQTDVSTQDEKILGVEVHPIHGWNRKPSDLIITVNLSTSQP
ncbi:MAG: hypothetical protein SAJ12_03715 [Jaaginema sp. PMC 1079.18]|nr:hypothetical protein [Jaaginema sp. PMC 1080.18]MEC4850096.1 hypothetical protein [Jaaginema sp. PMC 1079.18]MEC4864816.1 hypothetical protein [Jaaginema sp. PMC 1078.18]